MEITDAHLDSDTGFLSSEVIKKSVKTEIETELEHLDAESGAVSVPGKNMRRLKVFLICFVILLGGYFLFQRNGPCAINDKPSSIKNDGVLDPNVSDNTLPLDYSSEIIDKLETDSFVNELIKCDVELKRLVDSGESDSAKSYFLTKFLNLNSKIKKQGLDMLKNQVAEELSQLARINSDKEAESKKRIAFSKYNVVDYYKEFDGEEQVDSISQVNKLKPVIKKTYVPRAGIKDIYMPAIDPSKTVRVHPRVKILADEAIEKDEELRILIESGLVVKLRDHIKTQTRKHVVIPSEFEKRVIEELIKRATEVNSAQVSSNRSTDKVRQYMKEFRKSPQFNELVNPELPRSKRTVPKLNKTHLRRVIA